MDTRIEKMLEHYSSNNKEYIAKEIIQEIVLSGLSRSDFFKYCAFYGGTALRIIHKINRFSEDMDFVLYGGSENFKLDKYKKYIEDELKSYGLNFKFIIRESDKETKMERGNIKGNLKEVILTFYPQDNANKYNPKEIIRIKLEVSLLKDKFANTEPIYQILPIPYQMTAYDLSSLFSAKISAILTRSINHRIKGRDFFDYIYYMKLKAKPNYEYLKEKLIRCNVIKSNNEFNKIILKSLLINKFNQIDFEDAKYDVRPFIEDKNEVDIWSCEFFTQVTEKYFK